MLLRISHSGSGTNKKVTKHSTDGERRDDNDDANGENNYIFCAKYV